MKANYVAKKAEEQKVNLYVKEDVVELKAQLKGLKVAYKDALKAHNYIDAAEFANEKKLITEALAAKKLAARADKIEALKAKPQNLKKKFEDLKKDRKLKKIEKKFKKLGFEGEELEKKIAEYNGYLVVMAEKKAAKKEQVLKTVKFVAGGIAWVACAVMEVYGFACNIRNDANTLRAVKVVA